MNKSKIWNVKGNNPFDWCMYSSKSNLMCSNPMDCYLIEKTAEHPDQNPFNMVFVVEEPCIDHFWNIYSCKHNYFSPMDFQTIDIVNTSTYASLADLTKLIIDRNTIIQKFIN